MSGGQRFDRAPSMLKPYVACDGLVMELLGGIVDCHHLVVVVLLEVRRAPSSVKNGQKWSGHVMTVTTTPQIPENQGWKSPLQKFLQVLLVTRTQTSAFDVISYHFKRFFPTTTLSPNMFKTPWMLDRSIAFGPLVIKSYYLRKANRVCLTVETDSLYAVAGCPLLTSRTRRVPRGSPAKVWLVACPEENTSYGNVSKLWTENH